MSVKFSRVCLHYDLLHKTVILIERRLYIPRKANSAVSEKNPRIVVII